MKRRKNSFSSSLSVAFFSFSFFALTFFSFLFPLLPSFSFCLLSSSHPRPPKEKEALLSIVFFYSEDGSLFPPRRREREEKRRKRRREERREEERGKGPCAVTPALLSKAGGSVLPVTRKKRERNKTRKEERKTGVRGREHPEVKTGDCTGGEDARQKKRNRGRKTRQKKEMYAKGRRRTSQLLQSVLDCRSTGINKRISREAGIITASLLFPSSFLSFFHRCLAFSLPRRRKAETSSPDRCRTR